MTKPHYTSGCVARSQVCGDALSAYAGSSDYAWYVGFNNGNSNWNNRSNNNHVLAVRGPREFQGAMRVTLHELYKAWQEARVQKCSGNQQAFEANWFENIVCLQERINSGTWAPSKCLCFIATQPKSREIHAPDFADRVVHHWLIPHLQRLWERGFIYDSHANQEGKGTHAAVTRLRSFVRQVHSGQGGGYFLQLDIHNFFNSIHRPTLWAMLKPKMERAGTPEIIQRVTHALLRQHPLGHGVIYRATGAERAQIPPHKRLENSAPGCGLPIGNLPSQFCANVYLDALDQFVKHVLKVKRYVRYVDDFVLVHESREQLQAWQTQIETFLRERLRLTLKADIKLAPLQQGIDFLGYVLLPTHTRIRRRVVQHAREKLWLWQRNHIRESHAIATPAEYRHAVSIWASYQGHFGHANSHRLQMQLRKQFPWLAQICESNRSFDYRLEGTNVQIKISRTARAVKAAE